MLVSRPVGGILSAGPSRGSGCVTIHLCGLPEDCPCGRAGRHCPLLGLAPGGGCHPPRSPSTMVRSYRTVSALPVPTRWSAIGGLFSVARPSDRSDLALASTLALWSPDLPRRCGPQNRFRRGHPGDSPASTVWHLWDQMVGETPIAGRPGRADPDLTWAVRVRRPPASAGRPAPDQVELTGAARSWPHTRSSSPNTAELARYARFVSSTKASWSSSDHGAWSRRVRYASL